MQARKDAILNCFYLLLLLPFAPFPAMAQTVANDPDVLGAERLFAAWMGSQIAYRGLPGVAIGVVSDQELIWSKGFGYADVKAKRPMTAAKLFNAIAIMQLREEGKLRAEATAPRESFVTGDQFVGEPSA